MGVNNSIFSALIDRLASFSPSSPLSGTIPIAWPATSFTEPTGDNAMWIECALFPVEPRGYGLTGPDAIRRGYMQAMAVTRRRAAAFEELTHLADQIAGHFPEAAWYEDGGVRVQIAQPPGPQSMFEEDGKLKIPVIIRYQAFA